jgi:hypothetical protein
VAPADVIERRGAPAVSEIAGTGTGPRPAYFDVPARWPGPVTRSRLRRSRALYAAVALVGFALGIFGPSHAWRSFGLGLVLPGAGFLHYLAGGLLPVIEHLALAGVSAAAFAAAVVVWWWCGIVVLPVIAWLGAAIAAAAMPHHETVGGSWIVVAALVVVIVGIETLRKHRVRRGVAASVADNERQAMRAASMPAEPGERRDELSVDDLAALRFALDRALQPVPSFDGFHFGEQWQQSATRYQVFTLGWALALANANFLPAMRGYLQDAQLNLLDKARDPRLWSYWKWENRWGNLRLGADPLAHDNIMYSGYVGQQLALYQAATGDLRHDQPGSFTLTANNGATYAYDLPTIVEVLASQYHASPFGAWPCEPNWIYLFCNTTGANAIRAYDAVHGTARWEPLAERFERLVAQEFTRPNGDIVEMRSTYTGFTPPFEERAISNVNVATGLHPLCRERAEGLWWMTRDRIVDHIDSSTAQLRHEDIRAFDPGNRKRTRGFMFGVLLHGAREFGDPQVARAVEDAVEQTLESSRADGVLSYEDVSIWGHALLLMGRLGRTNGVRDLVTRGTDRQTLDGPVLAGAPYPDVLVARAASDGAALEMVLHPGRAAGRHHLTIGQIRPSVTYRLEGAASTEVTADQCGIASVAVDIDGRTPVRLVPLH